VRHHQQPTTIAILDANMVVGEALALLLKGEGYDTRLIERDRASLANGLLDGVDVLLLAPDLSIRGRNALLSIVRGNPKTQTMPVLTLTPAIGEVLDDESSVPVAWPSPIEELVRQIEVALATATSEEGSGPL
jgi:DNA-binding response OmpR family regulator